MDNWSLYFCKKIKKKSLKR